MTAPHPLARRANAIGCNERSSSNAHPTAVRQLAPTRRHPRTGKHINPQAVIGGPAPTNTTTTRAVPRTLHARASAQRQAGVTVREWRDEWITNPLWREGRGESP